jgi:[ribosomal protein S5]-alanine N-acetyltransferase
MMSQLLGTNRLRLRPFVQSDAKGVFEYWRSDQGWERFNSSVPADFTETDAEKFVADLLSRSRENQPTWAVLLEKEVVGIVSLSFEQGHRIAVIGYGVHGALRGRGVSAEASKVVIDCAFESYSQLRKIRAHTDARNAGSTRVLEKLGFSREGILKSNQFVKGEFIDEAIYGLLRNEWPG